MDWRERRSIDFFLQRTAPELEGTFTTRLWSEFLQLAIDDASPIRPALVAVASMHENYVMNDTAPLSQVNYSMAQYHKAIREVTKLDATKQEHAFDIAIAACILFSCIEGLRGHYLSLISHLASGIKIMSQVGVEASNTRFSHLTREMLQQLLVRINVQVMAISDECLLSDMCSPHLMPIPDTFSSANDAMFALEQLYCDLMHFNQSLEEALTDPRMCSLQEQVLRKQHQGYKSQYRQWTKSSTAFLCTESPSSSQALTQALPETLMLTIASLSVSISLDMDISNSEMDVDRFEDRFQDIVLLSEAVLERTPGGEVGNSRRAKLEIVPTFSMRFGLVPHLYWTASRCRNPQIRHRALHLLLTCNRREGLWDSVVCGRVAQRIISIEDKAALARKKELDSGEECILTSSLDVPSDLRVTVLWVKFKAGNKMEVCYFSPSAATETVETLAL